MARRKVSVELKISMILDIDSHNPFNQILENINIEYVGDKDEADIVDFTIDDYDITDSK